jgi:hypothetical protein
MGGAGRLISPRPTAQPQPKKHEQYAQTAGEPHTQRRGTARSPEALLEGDGGGHGDASTLLSSHSVAVMLILSGSVLPLSPKFSIDSPWRKQATTGR